jgi:hypothetical protein
MLAGLSERPQAGWLVCPMASCSIYMTRPLTTELGKFETSSDKLSKTVIQLTKWLIGLTIVVVILTIILVCIGFAQF